ncbi:hypothetical protein CONCODRAFT_14932 [Conidiobolus coronatus NRRL 28638]|uniref:Galactose oxidase n=1 Tax=Conidiobolus coronatus (strain ATCC 28846 / CBS 209.66 / NRRL 28638) TaxID=796925 RepID=A0A137PH43_CONC2|nr:hypothetical protein CONCODRAFT_14932 [Conidiobolus coronatus NRRL 28638]|eukprot:KXN74324.1 hypothetical protein CONCODRAFT_14932 [Conidiobolus coronatus NRRL 28638]
MFIILLFVHILSVISDVETLISATIRDNKLIAIYKPLRFYFFRVRVYELKEGAIADIFNNRKTFDFGFADEGYSLYFLDIPENFQNDRNKVWLKFEYGGFHYPATSPFMNWVGYINLIDMSLENASDIINFPKHKNFPIKGYTINTITNELGSALYIIEGTLYSKKDSVYSDSNSFYKFNFTSKEWTDMTYTIGEKLILLFGHKSVVIDKRYLVILGGKSPTIYDSNLSDFENKSLYNLTMFDTFTNNWENVNINADVFDIHITSLKFIDFLATVYNDKIVVFGGITGENRSNIYYPSRHLGIYDFKSKIWNWLPILNEDSSSYSPAREGRSILVFNDQLIICTDVFEEDNLIPIHVYDMVSQRMKSTLKLSNSSINTDSTKKKNEKQNQPKTLPPYAIGLISVCCTVLLGAAIYLLYRKTKKNRISDNGKTKTNRPIREVWANPDIDITNNIIAFDENNYPNTLYSNELCQKSEN